jgi:hypothetical protein
MLVSNEYSKITKLWGKFKFFSRNRLVSGLRVASIKQENFISAEMTQGLNLRKKLMVILLTMLGSTKSHVSIRDNRGGILR